MKDMEESNNIKDVVNVKFDKLYEYQKKGVAWLIQLHRTNSGAILADDMGLGKTPQTGVFLHYLFVKKLIQTAIIVVPNSLISNWIDELGKWCPDVKVSLFRSGDTGRMTKLTDIQLFGGILITTYGLIQTSYTTLSKKIEEILFTWGVMVIDEAQKIKNSCQTSRNIREIPTSFRLALSGTPLQNNLMELWNLVNFVSFGKLLGPKRAFKKTYADMIERGLKKTTTDIDAKVAQIKMQQILLVVKPIILRRTKAEFGSLMPDKSNLIPMKHDFVVWFPLSAYQLFVYKHIIESEDFQHALIELQANRRSNALVQITILRLLCNHPNLIKNWASIKNVLSQADDKWRMSNAVAADEVDRMCERTSKIEYLLKLLMKLIHQHCKILVFSQSRSMLDLISGQLDRHRISFLQLDGRVLASDTRKKMINKFQTDESIPVFLITTQTGGVGLNITAANSVVILEPSWNPGVELQAIDRTCRIGQTQEIYVYRLITCGTVEEKIYRRQVFKRGLTKFATAEDKSPKRYFSAQELQELMTLSNPHISETCEMVNRIHPPKEKYVSEFQTLIQIGAINVSDNGALFSIQDQYRATVDHAPFDQDKEILTTDSNFEEIRTTLVKRAIHIIPTSNLPPSPASFSPLISQHKSSLAELHLVSDENLVGDITNNIRSDSLITKYSSDLDSYTEDIIILDDVYRNIDESSMQCEHFTTANSERFVVTRCRCNVSPNQFLEYNELVRRGQASSDLPKEALRCFLEALQIIDDDAGVQIEARLAACHLGMEDNPDILPDYVELD